MPSEHDLPAAPGVPATAADALRRAMRRVASTVGVVTTRRDGVDHGMTVTAYSSVSLEPPLVLVVINSGASLHEPLVHGDGFCLNILDETQQDVAEAFARPGAGHSRFATGLWRLPPVAGARALSLDGAQAWMQCSVECVLTAGTHSIVTGRVHAASASGTGAPLLYLDGRFTTPA